MKLVNKFEFGLCLALLLSISSCKPDNQLEFTEISQASGINFATPTKRMDGAGAAFFDYNNDGWMDLYITGGDNSLDAFYHNNGDGTFKDIIRQAGLGSTHSIPTYGVVTGDIDNDGDRDLLITTERGYRSILMLNNDDGTFSNISIQAGISDKDMDSHAAAFGDYNLDGYLDFYLVGWIKDFVPLKDSQGKTIGYDHNCFSNKFYKNNGDNTFTEMSNVFGLDNIGCSLATTFSDFDNDNDMDILLANDFGMWVSPNELYENLYPTDGFRSSALENGMKLEMYGMGIAIGDYDHDKDLDYYFTSIDHNFFMQNHGNGTFADIARQLGVQNDSLYDGTDQVVAGWGTAFLDVNNDSFEDLFIANGKVSSFFRVALKDPNKLYLNNGAGGFIDISKSAGIDAVDINRSLIYADYDNDGDLDVLITTLSRSDIASNAHVLLYRNDLKSKNNWLQVELEGTSSNRDAFGAKIIIYTENDSWIHEVNGGSSYRSQHSSIAHFGLGNSAKVDSLEIIWPGGQKQVERNITARQRIKIVQQRILN